MAAISLSIEAPGARACRSAVLAYSAPQFRDRKQGAFHACQRRQGQGEEGRARLFGRPRHLDHPEVAAGDLSAPRSSPSPPTSARARSWSRRARKAEMLGIKKDNIFIEDLREEFVARLRVPDVPRQRALRGRLPARHLDRPAADRQEADRDRPRRPAPTPSATAPPARATTRCASSSPIMRSSPPSRSSRRGASGPSRAASS